MRIVDILGKLKSMKKINLFLSLLLAVHVLFAQNPVPNPSFENWSAGKPVGWTMSSNVTQVGPGHTGSYAVKGDKTSRLIPDGAQGFGVSQTYAYLNFYYKFNRVQSEYLSVDVNIFDTAAGQSICSGIAVITSGTSAFQAYSLPINCAAGTPSICDITFGLDINTGSVPLGSFFIIDDVTLTNGTTAVSNMTEDELSFSVSPVPSHDRINIDANPSVRDAQIEIYNSIGEKVKTMPWNGTFMQVDISTIPAGLYTVVLKNDGKSVIRKIQKD
jgi:hypothetical protein